MDQEYRRNVRRIIESAIETGNFELAQTYITESAEFDVDFSMALQEILDEAMADIRP